jgi:hypothetical protein
MHQSIPLSTRNNNSRVLVIFFQNCKTKYPAKYHIAFEISLKLDQINRLITWGAKTYFQQILAIIEYTVTELNTGQIYYIIVITLHFDLYPIILVTILQKVLAGLQ